MNLPANVRSSMCVAIASVFIAGIGASSLVGSAIAEPLALAPYGEAATSEIFAPSLREDEPADPGYELPAHLRRQIVAYASPHPAGTIVIDTANTYLYLVLGGGRAMRYGIGVGRDGFTWSGVEKITRMAEWPDWHPPAEMIRRQPYLPRFVAGGPGNPLGARALYLGNSQYRIHGTNDPSTIGKAVSSGCIRLTNEDVADLYARARMGATVVVLPGSPGRTAERRAAVAPIAARASLGSTLY
ncbi:L,D-transpeptidase [Xanthobacteraceae bacterium Astr-EGSB]|uniref:L,D-transpeptidase n=1 Tax=Astrobacterium formosum TaxID=3069710 RepID=UPI0027B432E1|nr:L,D-transpeptidase [Xanthobacteraceae bacterium Astr-EGSB]